MNKWKNRFYECAFALIAVSVISLTTLVMCKQSAEHDYLMIKNLEKVRDSYKTEADRLKAVNLHLEQRIDDLEGGY